LTPLAEKKILLIVSGGIAAYKAAFVCRQLIANGAQVKVIMTASAIEFIQPLTFESLTNQPVYSDLFPRESFSATHHIELADWADAILIAPATANIIAKINAGIADDLATTVLLAAHSPIVIAPAMNSNMWNNRLTQRNVNALATLGMTICPPDSGDLACGYQGSGRLPEAEQISHYLQKSLSHRDLEGKRVLISSGATREHIDPVRFITNHATGKMGSSIAAEAFYRGAKVTLVSGKGGLAPLIPEIEIIRVDTADAMLQAISEGFSSCDIYISAAAVADFTPKTYHQQKIKKQSGAEWQIELKPTVDILKHLSAYRKQQLVIGFAMESENYEEAAIRKLNEKQLDAIILNRIDEDGEGFASSSNAVSIFTKDGKAPVKRIPRQAKSAVAREIFDFLRDNLLRG
jgi:phosphopantothenoylcysteine decarboxylase/phosphopantothenate--cysteine ligase